MRNLKITRERKMNAAGVEFFVILDGRNIGGIENGGTANVGIDYGSHTIKICADMGDGRHLSGDYEIRPGQADVQCHIYRKFTLIDKNDICLDIR